MPSDALLRMARRWEREGNEPHGLVVIRHGQVVAEAAWQPWPRDGIRLVYSVSKTFLAIAAAFAEAEGLLGRDERLVDVFPEHAHAAGPRAARITVEHCLRMATGHHVDTLDGFVGQGEESVAVFLAAEPEEEPGSWFVYHNGASRVLALAVQRRTGERLLDYLRPRLLDPMGIDEAAWISWAGTDLGHSGLHVTTDAVARLGLLLLQDGVWEGHRLLPPGWVATASQPLTDTTHHPDPPDWKVGYGYQMWRSRHDGFRADGAYGQFALVVPAARPGRGRDVVHRDDLRGARRRLGGAAAGARRRPAATRPRRPRAARSGPRRRDRTTGRLHRRRARQTPVPGPSPTHPTPSTHACGRWSCTAATPAGCSRSTTARRCRCPVGTGGGRMPRARPTSPAAAGWARACSRRRWSPSSTPHSLLLRCADGEVTARWRGAPLHGPSWPGCVRPATDRRHPGDRLVPCSR